MALKLVPLKDYLASVGDKKIISFRAEIGHTNILRKYYLLRSKTKGKKTFYAKNRRMGQVRRFFSVTEVWVET